MIKNFRYAPAHPVVFLSDLSGGHMPPIDEGTQNLFENCPVQATRSCIALACVSDYDENGAEFNVGMLNDLPSGLTTNNKNVFDGILYIKEQNIALLNVYMEKLFFLKWPSDYIRVKIWMNHLKWPDKIIIGLGEVESAA